MTLVIASILIYHFGLPWWCYAIAGGAYALSFWYRSMEEQTATQNADARFNMLMRHSEQQLGEVRDELRVIQTELENIRFDR